MGTSAPCCRQPAEAGLAPVHHRGVQPGVVEGPSVTGPAGCLGGRQRSSVWLPCVSVGMQAHVDRGQEIKSRWDLVGMPGVSARQADSSGEITLAKRPQCGVRSAGP